MKCPKCGYNQKKKLGYRCTKCRYEFVFRPDTDKIADKQFDAMIRRASFNDTYYFTTEQLYAEALYFQQAGIRRNKLGCMFVCGLIFGIATTVAAVQMISGPLVVLAVVAAGAFGGWLGYMAWQFEKPRTKYWLRDCLKRWTERNGEIPRLLKEPRLQQPPPEWQESDIYDYGVERILFVERDILVDLFVLNGFHSQERVLIQSESGYPAYVTPLIHRALEANPQLPVFLLHDPTPSGEHMIARMREGGWADYNIVDLGLHSADLDKLPKLGRMMRGPGASEISADSIRYQPLANALTGAMAQGVPIATLMAMRETSPDAVGSYG